MSNNKPRILVTGALGVNGVWVMRALLGHDVDVLATDLVEDFELAPDLAATIEFRPLDATDLAAMKQLFAEFQPTVVVHLAAMLPIQCQQDPHRGYQLNVMATANVLKVARELGIGRVVFTSSKAAYGTVGGVHGHPTYQPIKETDQVRPVGVYDYAKLASEGLGINYAKTGGPEFAALRFVTIFAPGKVGRHGPMSLASAIIEEAVAGRPYRLAQGGDQIDDYLYVADVADAIVAATLHPTPLQHSVYNIGSGVGISLSGFAKLVSEIVPSADIEIGPGLDPMGLGISYYSVFDCSRAHAEFAFTPTPLETSVRDFVKALGG